MCPAAVNGKCPCPRPVKGKGLSFRASAHTGVGISHRTFVRTPYRDCHNQSADWFRNDRLGWLVRRVDVGSEMSAGQWRMKRIERVAAVKISSARRKAAQKFWAPQQDIDPYEVCKNPSPLPLRGVGDAAPYEPLYAPFLFTPIFPPPMAFGGCQMGWGVV